MGVFGNMVSLKLKKHLLLQNVALEEFVIKSICKTCLMLVYTVWLPFAIGIFIG